MNEHNKNGAVRLIKSLMQLFSMSIQSFVYTVVLYILMTFTWFGIELESFGGAFIAVAAVTVLVPFMLLVDISISILYETLFKRVPLGLLVILKKVAELLLLTCIVSVVDTFASTITLSLHGQTVFAFVIFLIMEWFMRKTPKKS